jgi:hypothetical protein
MRYVSLGAILWCAFFIPPAIADVFRCQGEAGEVLYTQHPCDAGTRLVAAPGVSAVATGVRDSEVAWLKARQKGKSPGSTARRGKSDGKRQQLARQQYQCQRKRASLSAVNADLRRGYKPAQGEKLRRRRAAYEDYLEAFCR